MARCLAIAILVIQSATGYSEEPKLPAEQKVREIFVPFEDLNVLLEGEDQRVLLTRKEYDELLAKAQLAPAGEKTPRSRVLLSAEYDATVQDGRATIRAALALDVLSDDLLAVPLAVSGVTLRTATLDGRPAPLGRDAQGVPTLFVQGRGRHELQLEMIAPLETSAAQQILRFVLPLPASTQWRLTVPGNVEVKSGAEVIRREVDSAANVTRFDLLPRRDQTTLVMSLNNRVLLQQRVILARSVLIDELTRAYDKLHATVSLAVPHGAVDRFRFVLPVGFEVTDVATPLLARWAVEKGEGDARVLDVLLREAVRETVVMNIVAVNHAPQFEKWTMPQLRPLDVASHVALVGLLAEERLAATSLAPASLIPIDASVLNSALPASVLQPEPGAPRLRPVATYFAPQADFGLQASFRRTDAKVEATSNLLFTFNDRQIQLRGGFALLPTVEPLFVAEIFVPAHWQVTEVTQTDGAKLPFELFPAENKTTRLQVRLQPGAPPGHFFNLFVHATSTPAGWLNEWSQTNVALPVFAIVGATRDVGAVAVQTLDDLAARPDQLMGLTPLDEKEKASFGLAETPTSLAYRYESQPYSATLILERPQPRITARTFSFLRLEPEGLLAHYELIYQVDHARARRLMLRLPASTPEALAIRGLDVTVKEFRSEQVNNDRRWIVELAEPRSGAVRLAVDFQQSLPNVEAAPKSTADAVRTSEVILPLVRAEGVVYQSGMVAVEGNMEFDVQVKTDARKVDVGELVDAEYQVGKRLLGAFGFVGEPGVVLATVSRRAEFGLPSAIVQRAELVTVLSTQGLSQTAARFQLRTKAPFLEIVLPANSTLWSAMVGDQPASPQRDKDRLLISLPLAGVDELRDLKLVYETPVATWSRWGQVESDAPRLMLRDETGTNRAEVPLADLQWHLVLPDGQRVVHSGGSVFVEGGSMPRSPAAVAGEVALGIFSLPAAKFAEERRSRILSKDVKNWLPGDANAPAAAEPTAAPGGAGFGRGDSPMMPPTVEGYRMPMAEKPKMPVAGQPAPSDRVEELMKEGAQRPYVTSLVPAPDANAPTQTAAVPPAKSVKDPFWALQGVRSLPVELARVGEQVTFHSLGVEPRLQVTLASSVSLDFLAAALAILVGLLGLSKTGESVGRKAWLVIMMGALLLAAPLVIGLIANIELTSLFAPAFYVTCALIPWYLLVGCASWIVLGARRLIGPRPARAAAATLLVLGLLGSNIQAQQPASLEELRHLLAPQPPVKAPANAVVIPYNPDDPLGPKSATKVFVPYAEYVKLWNQAFPDKPLNAKPSVTPYAIGGATYSATLDGSDSLTVIGRMEVDVFVEGTHQIPLPLTAAVLTKVTLDGEPARLQVIQPAPIPANPPANAPLQQATIQAPAQPQPALPAEAIPAVLVTGIGRKQLEFELRFKLTRSGGWRMVAGRVPVAAATALDLLVPAAKTEVRVGVANEATQSSEFETQQDQQTIHTALHADGQLQLQWRPKIAEAQVDQSLTARSTGVLDIQEDAVRLTWETELVFRRGLRNTFTFLVPRDMLLEKVLGANVRGWKTTLDGETVRVDVTLLKSATSSEKLTLLLSKRAAIGEGAMAAFNAPVVVVADAALHQGVLVVRRSPLLEVRVDDTTGLTRADANEQEVAAVLVNMTEDNPLGIRPFQTYRFAATPFTLRLAATPQVGTTAVEVQSLLKIADRERTYEARLNFSVANRPRYLVRCRLPAGLQLDEVTGPARMEWTTTTVDGSDVLSVFLPDGQQQFSLVLRGRLSRANGESFPAPRLEVLDVERQTGQLVVQADPAYDVRANELRGCENVLLEQVFGWLNEDQRRLARLALSYRTPDFAATLRVTARQPRVRSFTISNSRFTPFSVEDTVYLQFAIAEAGIRSVRFQLPAEMRDARITVPLLRQKTIEPIADQPGRIRVTLELQDEVTDQLIVLVEHDRALTGNTYDAPIPIVETGTTEQRFVVLESAGRDELTVTSADQLTELNRQQSQWMKLAETLGDRITRAYLVRDDATQPRLTAQTKQRATVETAGARIGLAKTLLIVDGNGAYRGVQEYQIDNKTEQYLEVELPVGAELWTARVATEPVKPVAVAPTGASRRVRVPLIKTAAGDLDYAVELKYGGRIEIPRGLGQVAFPLMHTINIHVELSQVRLRLPETQKWLDFGGSMRRVHDEQDLLAGFFAYKSKQVEQLLSVVQSEVDEFSKIRASNNLKQIDLSLHDYHDSYKSQISNVELQREFDNNWSLRKQAEQVIQQQAQAPTQQAAGDNRALLSFKCATQPLSRSKNVVTQLNGNFDADVNGAVTAVPANGEQKDQRFNLKWLEQNKLQALDDLTAEKKKKQLEDRVDLSGKLAPADDKPMAGKGEASRAATDLGRKVAESANAAQATIADGESKTDASKMNQNRGMQRGGEIGEQLQRYQLRIEQQQQGQTINGPAIESALRDRNAQLLQQTAGGLGLGGLQTKSEKAAGAGVPAGMSGMMGGMMGGGSGRSGMPGASAPPGGGPVQPISGLAIQPASPAQVALAGLKSLDVEFPERGVEFLFVTPRGEIAIEARAIEASRWQRLLPLGGLILGLAVIGFAGRFGRRFRQR